MDFKKVTVIGGGNIGTQFAGICASKGSEVTVYSSKPELFEDVIEVVDEKNHIIEGKINKATNDLEEAMEGCQLVFVTVPSFLLKTAAEQMLPYIKPGIFICVLPGTGGAEFAFQACINAGAVLCGLQRVPAVARLEVYGKRVRAEGLRDSLHLAAIPAEKAPEMAVYLEMLFGIPCYILPNYLSVTLTPSNPILHTTRLRSLFSDYTAGVIYERNPLFYGEWTDDSSELLFSCDEELQQLLRQLDRLDLSDVKSLKLHYESDTVPQLTAKMRSIKSLHNLASPMKQVEGGWVPDFGSRYFSADFPFGLAIIEELSDIVGTEAPEIHATMDWYRKITGNNKRFDFSAYGICSTEDLYRIYE